MSLPTVEVRKILQSSKPLKTAVEAAVYGQIVLRGLYWRILLGLLVVPQTRKKNEDDEEHILESWVAGVNKHRNDFRDRRVKQDADNKAAYDKHNSSLKKKTKFGDSSSDEDEDKSSVKIIYGGGLNVNGNSGDDPLSNCPTSQYAVSYRRQKLAACIDQDMERLWSDDSFFEDEKHIQEIRTVLLLYCENEIGYRQGMNEIAAFIVYVLYQDIDAVSNRLGNNTTDQLNIAMRELCSAEHVSADAYWIFKAIMDEESMNLSSWYRVPVEDSTTSSGRVQGSLIGSSKGDSLLKKSLFDENEITFVAGLVQDVMLLRYDEELSKHLKFLDIHAPTYCIRWLRLLFIREFPIIQTAKLWDGIFAEYCYFSNIDANQKSHCDNEDCSSSAGTSGEICHSRRYRINQSIILHIGVVMLEYIRKELLESDFSFALRRLMKYPPVEDTVMFFQRAMIRKYQGTSFAAFSGLSSANIDTKLPAPSSVLPTGANLIRSVYPPPRLVEYSTEESTKEKIDTLIDKQLRMGVALSAVVTSLERKWFPVEGQSKSDSKNIEDDYLVAIAQLKKIRDVMMNLVPED